ncbi:hypothetical protein VaNZ11_005410, partial [Volvox africanus]
RQLTQLSPSLPTSAVQADLPTAISTARVIRIPGGQHRNPVAKAASRVSELLLLQRLKQQHLQRPLPQWRPGGSGGRDGFRAKLQGSVGSNNMVLAVLEALLQPAAVHAAVYERAVTDGGSGGQVAAAGGGGLLAQIQLLQPSHDAVLEDTQ